MNLFMISCLLIGFPPDVAVICVASGSFFPQNHIQGQGKRICCILFRFERCKMQPIEVK